MSSVSFLNKTIREHVKKQGGEAIAIVTSHPFS